MNAERFPIISARLLKAEEALNMAKLAIEKIIGILPRADCIILAFIW